MRRAYPRFASMPCLAMRSARKRWTSPSATWAYRLRSSAWISATVRRPSHSFTMAAPVSLMTQTVSGESSACCPRAASNLIRTCCASRGRADSSMLAIGLVDRVEHAPQHVALERQRRQCRCLRLRCDAVFPHHLETMFGVAGSLGQSRPEVAEFSGVDPGVVAFERGEPVSHQIRGEQLGERRRHRLDPRPGPREGDVGVHGESHAREQVSFVLDLLPGQADGLAEAQPRLDPTGSFGRAVVVDDALDPPSAYLTIRAVAEERPVLPGNVRLVVEAVGDPGPDVLAARSAVVHPPMEGVLMVVVLGVGAERFLEIIGCQCWAHHRSSDI